jgi:hypothetical protein
MSPITSFPAFTTPTESITSFAGSQVILNSDRLLFNTKADSIIFNSSQHISISSVQSVGMYSKEGDITIQPSKGKVKLGDINASQSVILGDNFIDDFQNLLNKLNLLMTSLSAEPLLFLSSGTAASVKTQISLMLINLKNYKSKIVKAI